MSTKTVWVTGANGFIGSEMVRRLADDYGYNVVGTDLEVSIRDTERLDAFAKAAHPQIIINCAGIPRYATDLTTRIKAYETNALGAGNIAVTANSIGAKLIQISTDDVFPTRMHDPVNEFDNPRPETPYGKSKRAGETMVRDTAESSIIVRSSWVYSENGGILKDVLDAARKGERYEARTDQYSSPTSISTYVKFVVKAMEADATGVLHIASRGCASRYDFAVKALELCGYDPAEFVKPTTDLVTAEKVVLESLMLEMFGAELPTWEDDLAGYLEEAGLAKA